MFWLYRAHRSVKYPSAAQPRLRGRLLRPGTLVAKVFYNLTSRPWTTHNRYDSLVSPNYGPLFGCLLTRPFFPPARLFRLSLSRLTAHFFVYRRSRSALKTCIPLRPLQNRRALARDLSVFGSSLLSSVGVFSPFARASLGLTTPNGEYAEIHCYAFLFRLVVHSPVRGPTLIAQNWLPGLERVHSSLCNKLDTFCSFLRSLSSHLFRSQIFPKASAKSPNLTFRYKSTLKYHLPEFRVL